MKKSVYLNYMFPVIAVIAIITLIIKKRKEKFGECPKENSAISNMPQNAAEACAKISSRADEIKAHYGGTANIMKNLPGFALFNPNNYKSGDNTTDNMMRNIINTNMSKCEVEKIANICKNTSSSFQSNIIDTSMCEACNKDPSLCVVKDNTQINANDITQTCTIQTAIKALSEKKDSVDAQALAKVLQETEGLMSGSNTSTSENCNIINKDMSTQNYLETRNECLNSLNLEQENIMKGCGQFINNIQENTSKQLQECLVGTISDKTDIISTDTKVKSELDIEQFTKGIDTTALIISSVSSVVCILSILAISFYVMNQEI